MPRLELGGGKVPAPGHINIDLIKSADVVWDLNRGLPINKSERLPDGTTLFHNRFRAGEVEGIRAHQVLEHLDTIIPLMNDCYTVMSPGALFEISVPHKDHWEAWADPTHKRYFVEQSFDYFLKDSPFAKEQEEYGITSQFTKRSYSQDGWLINICLVKS